MGGMQGVLQEYMGGIEGEYGCRRIWVHIRCICL